MNTSPFELFRRNLKPFMVAATMLALISFVVLPILQTYMQQQAGSGGADGVVAKYSGTELTRSRVDYFTRNHQSTVRFLSELANETIARGGVPRTPGFQYDTQNQQIRSLGINQNPSTEGTVRTFMFASEAMKSGFELDDNALQVWLERFTDGVLSHGEIIARLMKSTQNLMGPPHLFEQLRNHLLADVYLRRGNAGLFADQGPLLTPDEQWANFLKLNRSAVVTTYGVLVNDYLDQTSKTPSDGKIREVYEAGKVRDSNDQSPEPGFHRRYTAQFEYVVGDYQTFLDEEIAKLTEDQIQAEYQRRLKGGDFQLPESSADEASMDEASMDEGDETESAAELETVDAESVGGDAETAVEGTNEPESAENQGADETGTPADEDQSSVRHDSSVRLVAFQDDVETSADAEPADDSPADEMPADEMPADEEPADEMPADEEPADEEPADEEPADEEPADEMPVDEEPADEEPAEEKPEAAKVESFEDVRDKIAADLAGPAARSRMDAAITTVTKAMRTYFTKMGLHQSNLAIGQKSDPPSRPDLRALAKSLGLKHEVIGPHSETTISKEPIAESYEVGTQFGRRGPSFTIMMYGFDNGQNQLAQQPPFAAVRTADDQAGKIYVSWKTHETEAYTPTLSEVRGEVVMAIRMQEARKLARAAADEIANKASAGASLESLVPDEMKPNLKQGLGPFSWMESFGFGGATIGNVPELDSIGDEFMKATFSSKVGDYRVAMNQPERVAYVITPTKFEPSIDELRRQFKQPINRMMARMVASDAGDIVRSYYDEIDKKVGFEEFINAE